MTSRLQDIEARFECKVEASLLTEVYSFLEGLRNNQGELKYEYHNKDSQIEQLDKYIEAHNLYFDDLQFSIYLDEGAVQKVFFDQSSGKVRKLNDAIFYVNWAQYLESLIVHNILFEQTRYDLIGFVKINQTIYSVVQQEYIVPDRKTDIQEVKTYMFSQGFELKKRNDYIHTGLGIIVEDLHEENVLVRDKTLFFINTVIYLK